MRGDAVRPFPVALVEDLITGKLLHVSDGTAMSFLPRWHTWDSAEKVYWEICPVEDGEG